MVAVTSRRNGNFSAPYSVAASITLAIAILAVLLASPARGDGDPIAFKLKHVDSGIKCITYTNVHCKGKMSDEVSLEEKKCYKITVGSSWRKGTKYVVIESKNDIGAKMRFCSDDACKNCEKDERNTPKFDVCVAGHVNALCTAVPVIS